VIFHWYQSGDDRSWLGEVKVEHYAVHLVWAKWQFNENVMNLHCTYTQHFHTNWTFKFCRIQLIWGHLFAWRHIHEFIRSMLCWNSRGKLEARWLFMLINHTVITYCGLKWNLTGPRYYIPFLPLATVSDRQSQCWKNTQTTV